MPRHSSVWWGDADWSRGWSGWWGSADRPRGWRGPSPGVPGWTPAERSPWLESLVEALRTKLLDRPLTVRTRQGDCVFRLTELQVPFDAPAVGQLGDVTATAVDLQWRDFRLERVEAVLRNPTLRHASRELVAAPVELALTLGQEDLARLVAERRPEVRLEVTGEGFVRAHWARHPDWGHLELTVGADGTRLRVRPTALVWRGRRLTVPSRLPPVSFRLPLPAERVAVHAVQPRPDGVDLLARVDQVRIPVTDTVKQRLLGEGELSDRLLDLTQWTQRPGR